jgi:hypothetical protein
MCVMRVVCVAHQIRQQLTVSAAEALALRYGPAALGDDDAAYERVMAAGGEGWREGRLWLRHWH